jgi:hypothetical protein
MTELHTGLDLYRDQLRDAIASELRSARPTRSRARAWLFRLGVPAGAVTAGVLAVTLSAGSPVQPADAAILRHVQAALTSPPGMILHEKAMVTASWGTAPYELWQQTSPPYAYSVAKWGHQGTGTTGSPEDFATELRDMVQSGQASVEGTTTINGVAAYKLSVNGGPDRFVDGTAYVAQSNYHPLEIDTTANGGERIVFQAYEYLPATAANMARITSHAAAANRSAGNSQRKPAR